MLQMDSLFLQVLAGEIMRQIYIIPDKEKKPVCECGRAGVILMETGGEREEMAEGRGEYLDKWICSRSESLRART